MRKYIVIALCAMLVASCEQEIYTPPPPNHPIPPIDYEADKCMCEGVSYIDGNILSIDTSIHTYNSIVDSAIVLDDGSLTFMGFSGRERYISDDGDTLKITDKLGEKYKIPEYLSHQYVYEFKAEYEYWFNLGADSVSWSCWTEKAK